MHNSLVNPWDLIKDLAPDAAGRREEGFTITNTDAGEACVRIYDSIGGYYGILASELVEELGAIVAPRIRVEINSPGGAVFDGIAIYNALRTHDAFVTTRVDGVAASIASIIAQAGDDRVVMSGGQMMIHRASGLTIGDAGDHSKMVEILEQQDGVLAKIYASRSGLDASVFAGLMKDETWFDDDAAVEAGLADSVVDVEPRDDPDNSVTVAGSGCASGGPDASLAAVEPERCDGNLTKHEARQRALQLQGVLPQ